MPAPEPSSNRSARFPSEYGVTVTEESKLAWSFVDDRLRSALNYWLASIGPTGRPHVRPVDGVWIEGALCFGGSPETRWVRNLQANPAVSINLGSETEAIILEGRVVYVDDASHELAGPCVEASKKKYPQYYQSGETPPFQPFWCLYPERVFAWTLAGFASNPTRWDFPAR